MLEVIKLFLPSLLALLVFVMTYEFKEFYDKRKHLYLTIKVLFAFSSRLDVLITNLKKQIENIDDENFRVANVPIGNYLKILDIKQVVFITKGINDAKVSESIINIDAYFEEFSKQYKDKVSTLIDRLEDGNNTLIRIFEEV